MMPSRPSVMWVLTANPFATMTGLRKYIQFKYVFCPTDRRKPGWIGTTQRRAPRIRDIYSEWLTGPARTLGGSCDELTLLVARMNFCSGKCRAASIIDP